MYPSHHPATGQQRRVAHVAGNADSYAMFNLLTGAQLLDRVEALLPEHRERLFLAQAISADGSGLGNHPRRRRFSGCPAALARQHLGRGEGA